MNCAAGQSKRPLWVRGYRDCQTPSSDAKKQTVSLGAGVGADVEVSNENGLDDVIMGDFK